MVTIKKVENRKELKMFIRFPYELYKNNPYWVPPLEMDEMNTLRKDKNPAFEHCDAEYWLAYKDGRIVGRIAGIINYLANNKWGNKVRFGWIDFIDDFEVVRLLISAVIEWGKSKGMIELHGPLGFNDMDKEGLLVDGFDKLPTIANIYNHAYYPKHLEKLGLQATEDWVQYKMRASQNVPDKIERINKMIEEKYNLKTIVFDRKRDLLKYGKSMFRTLNSSFSELYGFSPLSEKEIESIIATYFSFVNPKLICFVLDENDEVIGFGVSIPSLSKAFQKAKGKLFPFGFIHLLKAMRNTDEIDLYLNGVHPNWQKKGIHSLYYSRLNHAYIDNDVKVAITNPQLESNFNAVSVWNNYEKELYTRRRCYSMSLL